MSLRISSFSLSPFIVSSMRKKEEREGDDIKRHVIINISMELCNFDRNCDPLEVFLDK